MWKTMQEGIIMEEQTTQLLTVEDRNRLRVTGITDMDRFDEREIVLYTTLGELTVTGKDLHIGKISLETGELSLDGNIYSLVYAENRQTEGGFFSRLFR